MTIIGTYYYPGWHKSDKFDEWTLVREAKPYFKGHEQPRTPLLGELDDSATQTLQQQITLAQNHGIDAFIFDWYWKKGNLELNETLDEFVKIQTDFKFSLMWSWKLPKRDLPVPLGKSTEAEQQRYVETTTQDFVNLLEFCNEQYFLRPNYWKVDGKPHFVMYFVQGFIGKMGRESFKGMIHAGKEYMSEKGGIHLTGIVIAPYDAQDLGFDALTGYNYLPDFTPGAPAIQDYSESARKKAQTWQTITDTAKLPYIPAVSPGWDATPRGVIAPELKPELGFPWVPVLINRSPEAFGEALNRAIEFSRKQTSIVHICAWNEWSEGAYLEPDTEFGMRYLEEVKKAKSQANTR